MIAGALVAAATVSGQTARSVPAVVYVASALVMSVFICGPLYVAWAFSRSGHGGKGAGEGEGSDGEGEDGGEGPGGSHTPPRGSPKGSPGDDPDWWPEFERQFAAHVVREASRLRHTHSRDV